MPSNSISGDLFFKIILGHVPRPPSIGMLCMHSILHTITCIYNHLIITLNSVYTQFCCWLAWPLKNCFLRPCPRYHISTCFLYTKESHHTLRFVISLTTKLLLNLKPNDKCQYKLVQAIQRDFMRETEVLIAQHCTLMAQHFALNFFPYDF